MSHHLRGHSPIAAILEGLLLIFEFRRHRRHQADRWARRRRQSA